MYEARKSSMREYCKMEERTGGDLCGALYSLEPALVTSLLCSLILIRLKSRKYSASIISSTIRKSCEKEIGKGK